MFSVYKITNAVNGRCYIGSSIHPAKRWKQHIKRALGAEPLTQNKLYPAMQKDGVWNFTFEVVEKVAKDQLTAREKFYIDFYQTKETGLNEKRG